MTTLNLNGQNITLPDGTVFTTSYLTGSNDITNNNAGNVGNATLTEGGGTAGNVYSGIIFDGTAGTTAITQTSGYVDFTGDNTYSGGTNLEGGTIGLGGLNALGTGTLAMANGTTLQDANIGAVEDIFNNVTVSGNVTIDNAGGVFGLSGNISGSGSLTLTGSSELSLTGNNTYSGGTDLTEGGIAVFTNTCLGTGTLTMGVGSLVDTPVNGVTLANNILLAAGGLSAIGPNGSGHILTLTGIISGAGGLSVFSGEVLTLTGANTNSGPFYVGFPAGGIPSGATVILGNDAAFGTGAVTTDAGSILEAGIAGLTVTNAFAFDGVATLDTNGNTWTLTGVMSDYPTTTGSLTKTGSGALVLKGPDTYSGGTSLDDGTLALDNSAALGTGSLAMATGTTLQASASGLSVGNAMTLTGSDTVDTNGNTLTLSGIISGTGSLTKINAGTLKLTGVDTYTGGTMLDAGTLELGVGGSIAGNLTLAGTDVMLVLDAATSELGGDIAGATLGDGIDLRFQSFTAGDRMVWQQNGSTGTLNLETAGGTVLQSLTLAGQYDSGNFDPTSDGQNGTLIKVVQNDAHDFGADGFGDILEQSSSTGQIVYANMAGGTFQNWIAVTTTPGYSVAGAGQIDGGPDADIVLENSGGQIVYDNITNGASGNFVPVANAPGFTVAGVGDVAGTQYADVVLEDASTGQIAYANMNNGVFNNFVGLPGAPGYTVGAVADLNGDGYADIVVENSSGSLAYANMAGGVFNNWVGLPGTPGFTVVGGGDIAGTADADFVVEDSAGTIAYANMVNGQFSNWVGVATVPGWSVIAVEDVMGNGYDDIVIQNATTGQIAYADMTGGTFQGWVGVGSAPGFTGHTGPAAQAAAASAIFDPGPAATSQPNATTTTALADILTAGRLSGVP